MAEVYLVRHAKAGNRSEWARPDDQRPLSKKGRKQAERLAGLLADRGITRVVSSPFVRCVETVQPLADQLDLKVEEHEALVEGATADEVVGLVRELSGDRPVLCTHGDVIPTLLDALIARDGLELQDEYLCAKGATWLLETDGSGRFVRGIYLPAPS